MKIFLKKNYKKILLGYYAFYNWRRGLGFRKDVLIRPSVKILEPSKLKIGSFSTISNGSRIDCRGGVTIGSNSIISGDVVILSASHELSSGTFGLKLSSVTIGDNVWIAEGAKILPGSVIGDNVVISAFSIVRGRVKSGTLFINMELSRELTEKVVPDFKGFELMGFTR